MKKNSYKIPIFFGVFRTSSKNGGGEIRTHGPVTQTPVFKTGALDHSATPPFFTRPGQCFSFCLLRKIVPSEYLFSLKVFGQKMAGCDGLSLCRKRKS